MLTPYDWQEGIGHRQAYIQSRLAAGTPVLMLSVKEGILGFAVRRQTPKIYEIYDRLMFGAIGLQSDVDSMRVAAIEFAHQEGYNRSEDDVTITRVVAALSQPLKRAFADFNSVPFVVQGIFAEVGSKCSEDRIVILDADGDFSVHHGRGYLVGDPESGSRLYDALHKVKPGELSVEEASNKLADVWAKAMDPEGTRSFADQTKDLTVERALLRRDGEPESRFVSLGSPA